MLWTRYAARYARLSVSHGPPKTIKTVERNEIGSQGHARSESETPPDGPLRLKCQLFPEIRWG